MPSMMKKQTHNSPSQNMPDTDHQNDPERSWARLYERIRLLALRKSLVMLDADESEAGEFDRSARALRTLMSAAEVALRMKRDEAKECETNDQAPAKPAVTDAHIAEIYREIEQSVERFERRENTARNETADKAALPGSSGETVEPPRS